MATLALMDVSEITDNESLKRWLDALPEDTRRHAAIYIARRSALRVLPYVLKDDAYWRPEHEVTALSLVWSIVVSETADSMPFAAADFIDASLDAHLADTEAAGDAAYAAVDAAGTVKYDDATSQAASAVGHAAAAFNDTLWDNVRDDARWYSSDQVGEEPGLLAGFAQGIVLHWSNVILDLPAAANSRSDRAKTRLEQGFGDWTFWIDWFDAHIAGEPLPVDGLLEHIVRLPEELWTGDPATLNAEIMAIYDAWKASQRARSQPQEVLQAAIFDFDYDLVEQIMFAVPFDDDWRELEDEERLAEMLKDLASFRKKMELLCKSLEREGARLQGGGILLTYLEAILGEFDQAADVGKLLVGEIAENRRVLENAARDEQMQQELGVLTAPFDDVMEKLTDLLHRHFASTLARFTPLREMELEQDADPWEVLSIFRDMIVSMRTGVDGKIPALRERDAAVFDNMLDDLERLIREQSRASDPKQVGSLQREVNFAMAKTVVSMTLFAENSYKALPKFTKGAQSASDVAGKVIKAEKNANGIMEIVKRLSEHL